jgi:RNA polymerase sigma-70 factor (ECF subfamily)
MTTDWPKLVHDHGPLVWRTAYRLLNHHADAADCVQETYATALRLAQRQPVADWPALLRRLATARALDRLRQRYRDRAWTADVEVEASDPGPNPVECAEGAELAERLRHALARLSPREAEVFCLRCVDDLSYGEIAAQLEIEVNAVGVLLHRARERLKGLLAAFLTNHDA